MCRLHTAKTTISKQCTSWKYRACADRYANLLSMYSITSMTRTPMTPLQWLGWFELVFESLGNSFDSSRKQIFRDIIELFLFYHEIVCCVYSLESPHRAILMSTLNIPSFYSNRKNIPKLSPPGLALWLTLTGSICSCLKQSSMVTKLFDPLKLDCILRGRFSCDVNRLILLATNIIVRNSSL